MNEICLCNAYGSIWSISQLYFPGSCPQKTRISISSYRYIILFLSLHFACNEIRRYATIWLTCTGITVASTRNKDSIISTFNNYMKRLDCIWHHKARHYIRIFCCKALHLLRREASVITSWQMSNAHGPVGEAYAWKLSLPRESYPWR